MGNENNEVLNERKIEELNEEKAADVFTFDQVKEPMKMHEDTIFKVMDGHVGRLDKKIHDLQKENYELKKSNETLEQSMVFING